MAGPRSKMTTGKDFQLMIIDPYNPTAGYVSIPLMEVFAVEDISETDTINGIHGDTQSFSSDSGFKISFKVGRVQNESIDLLDKLYKNRKTFTALAEDAYGIWESNEVSFIDKPEYTNEKADRSQTFHLKFPPDTKTNKDYTK
jgi:hypothetical protein